jgi:hypothetical protein
VNDSLQSAQKVAAGIKSRPSTATAFAQTQAAWRFLNNERVSLPALAEPLLEQGRTAAAQTCTEFALVVHDWSHLNYNGHTRKTDRVQLGHSQDHGYELQTALLVSDQTGDPLTPLCQNLVAAQGIHTTRAEQPLPLQTRLDELAARMAYLEGLPLGRPLVHLIDREADSVGHYRQWTSASHRLLIRAKERQRVQHEGPSVLLGSVARSMRHRGGLTLCREVEFHGRAARQYVGETAVVLTRPTRRKRKRGGRVHWETEAGEPVAMRLIVSEVRDERGRLLAQWLLLSNVEAKVDAATLALWYYWRWRIETFFKLLKGAGHQVEEWQQSSAEAIARRRLVVSMGCVLVWQLGRSEGAAASEMRGVLVRLSGRQMKWGRSWTSPALLAGLWVLLGMLELLEHHDVATLRQWAHIFFNPEKRDKTHALPQLV